MNGYRLRRVLWLGLPLLFLAGCGTLGSKRPPLVPESRVFRPLDTYESPAARDLAQLLYPSFRKIRQEIQAQFQDHSLRCLEHGFEVVYLNEEGNVPPGYYMQLKFFSVDHRSGSAGFVTQAEQLGARYLPAVFLAMSRDWENIFSPSLTGTVIEYHWKTTIDNRLRCIIRNGDIQRYLNDEMTLQELVDKNWIEGWRGRAKLGRIELNALQPATI